MTRLVLVAVCALTFQGVVQPVSSCPPPDGPAGYPLSLEQDLKNLRDASAQNPSDPQLLIALSDVYLDLGNVLYTDPDKRISAYEEGTRLAQRALDLQEDSAQAHFLYAATLGEAAELKGIAESFLSFEEIRVHVRRSLDLQKDYVPALHMAGMMLDGLPGFMGGNPAAGLEYVKRAVMLDPTYTQARLNLARMYVKRNTAELAIPQLQEILTAAHPKNSYAWSHEHCPAAQRLLDSLQARIPQ